MLADSIDTGWTGKAVQVVKLYRADGVPAILSVAQIPESVFQTLPAVEEWSKSSNFQILYSYGGRIIQRDKLEIKTHCVCDLQQKLPAAACFPCASVLSLRGLGFDQDNQPTILGTAYYNTDLVVFNIFRHS